MEDAELAAFNRTLKEIAAILGIEVYPHTDPSGRTFFSMDRHGMLCMQRAMRRHGFLAMADEVQRMLDRGPDVVE